MKSRKREEKRKPRPPSKAERELAAAAEHARLQAVHLNSAVIQSRVRVLQFEAEELEKSEAMLRAALENNRARRAQVGAALSGLGQALAGRC